MAASIIAGYEADVRLILGEHIWGTDNETLEGVVGKLLTEKGASLAVMESCTGGLLATTITDISGASTYFKGGLVAYSNEAKVVYGIDARLITDYGAVSAEIAQAMAETARLCLGADVGIGVTGVAGPNEIEGKPAGVVYIGVDDGKSKRVIKGNYPGDRARVKRRATTAALFELRKMLSK